MPSFAHRHALTRATVESAAHIASAHLSCRLSKEHIVASRLAIGRSLDLLLTTSGKVFTQRD